MLTSRRGAWWFLIAGVLLLVALIGGFGRAEMTAANQSAAPDSESARVAALSDRFPDVDDRTIIVVASAGGGELSLEDTEALEGALTLDRGHGVVSVMPLPRG